MTKTPYDRLPLMPAVVAKTVAGRPYTGSEVSNRGHDPIETTEALRRNMTPAQVQQFVEECDRRCRAAYEAGSEWFLKCVRAGGDQGRDQLYVWITHWLVAFLAIRS